MKVFKSAVSAVLAAAALVLLVSCASAPYVQKENSVLRLIELINEGGVTGIDELTMVPFVLDTETLYLESDITTLWENLYRSGFVMTDAQFVQAEPVTPESYKLFADTFDMKNFFDHYTDKDTSIVTVDTREGLYYLLLERPVRGYPRIRGIRGPIR